MDDRWDYSLIAYLLLALSLLLMGTNSLAAEEQIPGPVEGEVIEVVDGDTVRVVARVWLDQNIEVLVRIRGIDAPERYGDCPAEREAAAEAREVLAAVLSSDRLVALSAIDRDKYFGRVVAEVTNSTGVSLGQHMLGSGWVRAYDGGARQPLVHPDRTARFRRAVKRPKLGRGRPGIPLPLIRQ